MEIDSTLIDWLPEEAQEAVRAGVERINRSLDALDVAATIGFAKELAEAVSKATIDTLGGSYGSRTTLRALAGEALRVVGTHPSGLQDRPVTRDIAGALVTLVDRLAELRNSDGTGHGRGRETPLELSHSVLAADSALGYCRWILACAKRVHDGRREVLDAAFDIEGGRVFTSGQIPELLETLGVNDLDDDLQHRLGLAVARRWSVNETFLARVDVITPLSQGDRQYPDSFATGVIEGLTLDFDGNVHATPADVELLIGIARQMDAEARASSMGKLAELIIGSRFSPSLSQDQKDALASSIQALAEDTDRAVSEPMTAAARHIRDLIAGEG